MLNIVNLSLMTGTVSICGKTAVVKPLPKKQHFDPGSLNNHRLLERVVSQLRWAPGDLFLTFWFSVNLWLVILRYINNFMQCTKKTMNQINMISLPALIQTLQTKQTYGATYRMCNVYVHVLKSLFWQRVSKCWSQSLSERHTLVIHIMQSFTNFRLLSLLPFLCSPAYFLTSISYLMSMDRQSLCLKWKPFH